MTEVLVGLLRVPHGDTEQVIFQDLGLTARLAGSLVTVAVITEVPPAPTGLTDGERETRMAGTSMLALADFVGSVTDVAVIVTCTSLGGGVAGAL